MEIQTPQHPNLEQQIPIIKALKSKDTYPEKAKGMSFLAFLFSVSVSITIFYIFKLSPSKLFSSIKFWWLISNTLVVIIAADYGAFSSSLKQHDCSEECVMRRQRSVPLSVRTRFPVFNNARISEEEAVHHHGLPERIKLTRQRTALPDQRRLEIAPGIEPDRKADHGDRKINGGIAHDRRKKIVASSRPTIQRSKSDVPKSVHFDESRNVIRMMEIERCEPSIDYSNHSRDDDDEDEETNKYANMSNEELNRRVEEFIQSFNKQIRLQR